MTKQQVHKFVAKAHKWVGLVLGLQVLAWTVGGIVMTWLPINEVRGRHKVEEHAPVPFTVQPDYLAVNDLLARAEKPVVRFTYDTVLGRAVIKLVFDDGDSTLLDAKSGEKLSPIGQDLAQAIAEADFAPDVPVASVTEYHEHTIDYRGPLPVWQVRFADDENTSIYVSPVEARVVARRSATWRLFDFFWMLHIMDYDDRDDINNPLLMTFALFATLFSISGLGLLYFRFYRRDFNWLLGRKKKRGEAQKEAA